MEIFNFFRIFVSNLQIKLSVNSVILMNSVTLTAHRRRTFSGLPGSPSAALGFALALHSRYVSIPRAPGRAIKPGTPSSPFLSLLCFPTSPPQLRRVPLASSAQTSLGKVVLQLRLVLLNPSQPLWLSGITENLRLRLFFLTAGDLDRSSGSPRPASSGEPLSLFVGSIASS